MRTALLSGTAAGVVLFIYQYVVIVPRIIAAEAFETHEHTGGQEHHHKSEWKPEEGWERHLFTAAGTILTGIGFAALLVSMSALGGYGLNVKHGLLWGLAGFLCFTVAPALGLPPEPPGVPVADLRARQLWWLVTAAATAAGLILIGRGRNWIVRICGGVVLVLPHVIGAPHAPGQQVVPAHLVREFAVAAIVGNGLFWLVLGGMAGVLFPTVAPHANNAVPKADGR
jgi:cobalt transporter subunit CbtA